MSAYDATVTSVVRGKREQRCYAHERSVEVDVLPNAWNQSVPDVVHIFDVTGQIPHKHFFFVQDACNENGYKHRKQKQCPPRSERKWRADEKKQGGKVHRMTDKSVYAC